MAVNSAPTAAAVAGGTLSSRVTATGGPRPGPAGTLTQLFFETLERFDKPDALQYKADGAYHPISHRDLATRVRRVALGLAALGVERGDRVGIISENRAEWAIADFACLTALVVDVPVYPNLPPDQVAYLLRDCGASAVFVSTGEQAAKVAAVRAELPALRHVIGFGAERFAGADLTLAELEARGAALDVGDAAARYKAAALSAAPGDVFTILYTSGTTGEPKGVMLTHDNLYSNVQAARTVIPFTGRDVALSFLPLSHIFERMTGHYLMFSTGTSIAYAESIDTIAANMGEVRPTLAASVPRVYEKIYARVLEGATSGSPVKKRIFFWARAVADRWADEKLAGRTPGGLLAVQYAVAQKLVFSKLKARVGGNMRFFVSGGAPLAPEINKFFFAAGLTILEGYGLTETSPVIAVNPPNDVRIGTVGPPLPGVEVMIAEDGEILTRGPHVMKGYYNKPEATREVIDAEGWLHTGDVGELRDGYLTITDRKKDIIVTSGGKNIAPQPIENKVKTNRYVSQAVMIGDRRRFPSILIVPDWDQVERWARGEGLAAASRAELAASPAVHALIEAQVQKECVGFAHFEAPKRVAVLEHEFSIERGELTPKLSVKRRVVDRMYKDAIDRLYVGEPP
ncbi:MAG: Long-chain-fatty-acid--CoA ligase, partial [uncultured Gemmatimonadaceae bacterium]